MAVVILPGTNRVVQMAFAGLRAEQRKAAKTPAEEPVAPVKKKPVAKAAKKAKRK